MRSVALFRVVVVLAAVAAASPAAASGAGWSMQDGANLTTSYAGIMNGVACASASSCVAVGRQFTRDGSYRTLVERWDGTSWTVQPAPSPSLTPPPGGTTFAELMDVACPAANECFAVGRSQDAEAQDQPLLERWDGTSWTIQPTPAQTGALSSISCTSPSACTVVGAATAMRWDGSTWTVQTPASPAGARGISLSGVSCTSATSCTATGRYSDSQTNYRALAEHWDGTSWAVQPTVEPSGSTLTILTDVSCTSDASCTAVGFYVTNTFSTVVERWDGTSWTIQPSPNRPGSESGNRLLGVSCASATACVAVGEPGSIEQWDGTSWTLQTSLDVPLSKSPDAVACTSATACIAVGNGIAARWDGTTWTNQDVPTIPVDFDTDLAAISCTSSSACVSVGDATDAEQTTTLLVKRWDGTAWTQDQGVPDASNGFGSRLTGVSCASPSACLAVGNTDFGGRGGTSHVAFADRWDGTRWTALPLPRPNTSEASDFTAVSCTSAASCYAVGHDAPVGVTQAMIMRWNGTAWTDVTPPASAGLELTGISCTSASACTAVGSAGTVPLAERWNGSSWSIQPAPLPAAGGSAALSSVSCASSTSCTAVGQAGGQALAERWNGSSWIAQPAPVPAGTKASALSGVSCRTASACTATGYADDAASKRSTLALRSQGSTWSIQPTPNPTGAQSAAFTAVSCPSPNACNAVGDFTTAGNENLAFAEGWAG